MNITSKIFEALLGGRLTKQRTRSDFSNAQSAWQSRLTEVESLFSEQSSMLSALRAAMQKQETKVGSFRQMLSDKDATLHQLHVKLNNTEVNLSEQHAKVASLETEQDRFHQELRVNEATLETLGGRIHELEQQLIEQGNTLKDLEAKHQSIVADKNGEIEKLGSWVTELEPLAIQMQSQVLQRLQTEYQSAITDKDGEIERLRTRVAELQPLQDQIKQRDVRTRERPGQEFHEPRLRDSPPKDVWAGPHELAVAEQRRAVELNPSNAIAYIRLGNALDFAGRPEEGIPSIERGLQLNPRDPRNHIYACVLAQAHFNARHYEKAEAWARKAIRQRSSHPNAHLLLAMSLGHLGRQAEARAALDECERLQSGFAKKHARWRSYKNATDQEHWKEGLHKAGWSE